MAEILTKNKAIQFHKIEVLLFLSLMPFMKLIRFLKSKTFFANLGLALVILIAIYFLAKILLGAYTRHDQSQEVPDVIGLHFEDAAAVLEENTLTLDISDSSEFNIDYPGQHIYSQYPSPGSKVKKNRAIRVTVNPRKEKPIALPNVLEKSRVRALAELESRGFIIQDIQFVPYIGKDIVVEVRLKGKEVIPGTPLIRGTKLVVVLGEGLGDEFLSVPYLGGLKFWEAKALLSSHLLNIGAVLFESEEDTLNAVVYKQYPPYGDKPGARSGSDIDIWLTLDNNKVPSSPLVPSDSLSQTPE
jgi:eukaryotic-like serine/threonine-protein kinase